MKDFFVKRPIFSIVISIIIVILGSISIMELPIEQYPDITPPQVSVSATYRGADAEVVDQAVATPIAQSIMGVSDLLYVQTTSSSDGAMNLEATFEVGSDQDMDAIFTQNSVATATPLLPVAVREQGVTTLKSMSGFLMVYTLYSDGRYDDTFLTNYAAINVRNELLKIAGVGQVSVLGSGNYSMRVWINPDKLKYYNLGVSEITSSIESWSGVNPAGKLGAEPMDEKLPFTYTVTLPPQISTPEQYRDIIVKSSPSGGVVRLSDVARVEFSSEIFSVNSLYNEKPASLIIVYQTPGSNAVAIAQQLDQKIETLTKRLPDGVYFDTIVNGAAPIKSGMEEIVYTLLFALLLVVVVIFLFIQEWRTTLIPIIAIPVSLIGAFMLFPIFGFSLNVISLLGIILAVGLVVDDAIVVVEAVQANMERGESPFNATLMAVKQVAAPVVTTTIILVAVFVPVSFISGITGLLYRQFAITITLSVVISAFNALTLTPALSSLILKPKRKSEKGFFGSFNRGFERTLSGYDRVLNRVENHRGFAVATLLVIALCVGVLSKKIPTGFIPEEDQGFLMVVVNLPEAASLDRTTASVEEVMAIINGIEGVESSSAAAGFNLLSGTNITSSGVLFVELKPFKERTKSSFEIADMINGILYEEVLSCEAFAFGPPAIPGLGTSGGLTLFVQDRSGGDLKGLAENTYRFIDSLKANSKFASVMTQFNDGIPQRKLTIDNQLAMVKGVDITELHTLIGTYLGGTYINNFNRFGKLYETYIQAESSFRSSAADLDHYFIEGDNSEQIPLSTFVTIIDTVGVEFLTQFNLYPAISLNISLREGVSSDDGMESVESVASEVLPADMTIAWSGTSYQQQNRGNSLYIYLLVILFVYLTLTALYDSWVLPLSIIFGVPLALFGSFLFVWIWGFWDSVMIDNIFMQISLVMLIGLTAKNAILIIEYAQMEFFENKKSLREAAISAAKRRIRPILMTAFAFILGVSPLIFASGIYSIARNVMGVTLVGGMLIATILGLFLYPSLYILAGEIANFKQKREKLESENESSDKI